MASADQRTIAAGTPAATLMERAGVAVAWDVRAALGGCYGKRVVVVCGKGNNGGDGAVVARVLARWGARTRAFELTRGIDERSLSRALASADAVVDAMFGTGLQRALEGDAAMVVDHLRDWDGLTVAVDIPSGIDGLTGAACGTAVHADRTVTFAARKPGLLFEPGRSHAGVLHVADIGIDLGPDGAEPVPLGCFDGFDVARCLPPRAPDAHKWSHAVMVVGGSPGMTGAPMFTSHAATRAGAGMVWCSIPGDDAAAGEVVVRALPDALAALDRFRAVAVGPGLGAGDQVQHLVRDLLARAAVPVVLDADALNALAGDLEPLAARRADGRVTVLTPHDAEFARIAGAPVGADRIMAARALADRSGAVVLLKGPGTVVTDPTGRAAVNPTGSEALASAGTGDVLTGIVAAFLARGAPAFEATAAAAWVHGAAADSLQDLTGPTGLVASDLVAAIAPTLLALRSER